jgi:two-component system cell cycle response regulator DivK
MNAGGWLGIDNANILLFCLYFARLLLRIKCHRDAILVGDAGIAPASMPGVTAQHAYVSFEGSISKKEGTMPTPIEEAVILIVEDNADNLFIVTDILKEDVRVKYVNARASGRQLFKLLESKRDLKPDLILLDLQIPYEDGYTVLRQIRARPTLGETTVVAITANVLPQDVERTRREGFDGFIGKPIDLDRFPQQVRRILSGEAVWEAH